MARRGKWRSKEAVKIAIQAGLEALQTGGEAIITSATNNVPIETGTLRRSATVTVGGLPDLQTVYEAAVAGRAAESGKEAGKEKAVYVSYNTPYARRMHEDMDYTPRIAGGPKYLENAFNQLRAKIKRMAELRIKKALRDAD